MITSFGIADRRPVELMRMQDAAHVSFMEFPETHQSSLFYRMPPVSFRSVNEAFMPDFELLILSDAIVMDERSFQQLVGSPSAVYSGVADMFRALKADGRVELVDFSAILEANSELLDRMLDHDLRLLDQWVSPLKESLETWHRFSGAAKISLDEQFHLQSLSETLHSEKQDEQSTAPVHFGTEHMMKMHSTTDIQRGLPHEAKSDLSYISLLAEDALRSSELRRKKEYKKALREALRSYLRYVNANLVLSNELCVPFHDWLDFSPFYATKFLSVGRKEGDAELGRREAEKLFTIAFPELTIRDSSALLKILNDKRVEDLRRLISDAVDGKVQFDGSFAKAVVTEVLKQNNKVARFRNILGYTTLPLGFIPTLGTPIQKVVEEAIARPVARKLTQKNRWYYMLSEVCESKS
jgi:hypothetical protein